MIFIKALVALVLGAIVYWIAGRIFTHFGVDEIWAFIVAVIVALAYFFGGPDFPSRV